MKKLLLTLAALCAFSIASAQTAIPAPAPAVPMPATAGPNLTKELADAKAQVQALQAQSQQQAITAEYYKAVAEKNEAYLRLIAVSNENEALKKQLADAKVEAAKQPPTPAKK